MKVYSIIRRTEVVDDTVCLPRPKITSAIIFRGTKIECEQMLDQIIHNPENQSDGVIEVTLRITGDKRYKEISTSTRKFNGK